MTATRGDNPFGATDVLLGVASLISIASAFVWKARQFSIASVNPAWTASRSVLTALAAMNLALLLSTLLNWELVQANGPDPLFNYASYAINPTLLLALYLEERRGRMRTFLIASNVFALIVGIVYLAGYFAGFEQFFYYTRFIGLSENPNQTALHMLSFEIVALMTLAKVRGLNRPTRAIAMLALITAFIVGILSQSDAFTIAAVVTIAGLGAYFLGSLVRSRSLWAGAVIFFGIPILLCLAIILNQPLSEAIASSQNELSYGNQDVVRYVLWQHGIDAWLTRPILGNGVGQWSGFAHSFESYEAHNSVIDWLSCAGLLGMVLYAAMVVSLFMRSPLRYTASYFATLSLLTFSMFHYTFRQPSFWLCFVVIRLISSYVDALGRHEERLSGRLAASTSAATPKEALQHQYGP